ncbi:hypothetical protein ACXAUS_001237 [Clostridium sporogenes]|uniref:hypothetical protein n=1 Tax=Clostridium sporogenes TaxID=1509 RepID=UPI000AEA7EED|nr:hypothetical protein [Clostridium sporogenes]EJE7234749.1 hypothetical protein [Clostridium botulinum]HDK7157224.1 hypothetical protein [Clostridium botulinum]
MIEGYLYLLMKALKEDYSSDNSLIKEIGDKIKSFVLSPENIKVLKLLLRGNSFKRII